MDTPTFNILSLCSGIGGFDIGLNLALSNARTICYVEREAFCQATLVQAFKNNLLDEAPIWTDVKTFDGSKWRGAVDCIIAGYPCQPFSIAGKKQGEKDPRHLWPDIAKIINEVHPSVCFFENVARHLSDGFEQVAHDLQAMGYTVTAGLFTASEIGAPHQRKRLFILAYVDERKQRRCWDFTEHRGATTQETTLTFKGTSQKMEHTNKDRPQKSLRSKGLRLPNPASLFPPYPKDKNGWSGVEESLEPSIFGMVDGISDWSHAIAGLGNAVVPLQAAYAFSVLGVNAGIFKPTE